MAFVNFATREITAKIVYYGPGLGGKTTSLQYIHNNLAPDNRGKMISLATEEDRTIYFDFLPLNLGKIQDFAVRVQLYTVPGQVRYNATRKLVLRGADGLVFVADSQRLKKLGNLESFNNMEENLKELGKELKDLPHVLQFNKVDLPDVMPSEEMSQTLNRYNIPFFETVATTGIGILDTLKSITKLVFNDLSKKALLQKKSRVTTPLYTAGGTPIEEPLAAAAAKKPKSVTPPPPSYFSSHSRDSKEISDKAPRAETKEAFTGPKGPYTEIEFDEKELEQDPLSVLEPMTPNATAADVEEEPLQEVEPIAEFDEPATGMEDTAIRREEPAFDLVADDAQELEEQKEQDETYPEVTAEEIEVEKEAEKLRLGSDMAPFSYGTLFEGSGEFSVLMHNLEKQIAEKNFTKALNTARTVYHHLITHLYPKQDVLDGNEALKIFALDIKFKRFLRFKRLLDSEPDTPNLLYIHHFLCDLYLSLREL